MLHTVLMEASAFAHHLLPQIPLPNPTPSAPAEVTAGVTNVMAIVKWASLIAAVIGFLSFGLLSLAADSGGYGSQSADMKEKLGKIIMGVVIVCSASSLVSFIYF